MSELVFPPPVRASLAVVGKSARFPVRHIFCTGRNHWRPSDTRLRDAGRKPPCFFMKPACAVGMAAGRMACPPRTNDFFHEIELIVTIGTDSCNSTAAPGATARRDPHRAACF